MKKKLFSVPLNRLLYYCIFLSLLPPFFVLYTYLWKQKGLVEIESTCNRLQEELVTKEKKQAVNYRLRNELASANSLFLEKQLENLSLLSREKVALEKILLTENFTGNEELESRFSFIASGNNRLRFVQSAVQTAEKIQESIESLSHPVEINSDDLKEILHRIEEKIPGKPQLLVMECKLARKKNCKNELYELTLKLLKREFLS